MKQAIGHGLVVAALACSGGCASDQLNLGDGKRPTGELGASLSDYAGRWEGHAEAYMFEDGSDRIRLTLDEDGDGVLEVGDSPALPEPDPEVGYPPGVNQNPKFLDPNGSHVFYAGFEYSIEDAQVESKRIRFNASSSELFREWCEQQEPELDTGSPPGEPEYACAGVGNGFTTSGNPDPAGVGDAVCLVGEAMEQVDCNKVGLCLTQCQCDADSCSSRGETDAQLDAELESEGEELEGTLLIRGERIIVRMNRE